MRIVLITILRIIYIIELFLVIMQHMQYIIIIIIPTIFFFFFFLLWETLVLQEALRSSFVHRVPQ